jgi:hypothetical protein
MMSDSEKLIDGIATDLHGYLSGCGEQFYVKTNAINKISDDDLGVLCKYLSARFIARMFNAKYQVVLQRVSAHFKSVKETTGSYVPEEPSGIGGWKFADRLKIKAFTALQDVVNQGVKAQGQQLVQACKTLVAEADKMKDESIEIMQAYEKQLLILASHIVEKFLPAIQKYTKKEIKDIQAGVLEDVGREMVEARRADELTVRKAVSIWSDAISKFHRKLSIKRFELLFADSLRDNRGTREAFELTKGLLDKYGSELEVEGIFDDEAVATIRQAQEKARK